MLLAAEGTPHLSPDLGQPVDAVRVDRRGNLTTRARTPDHQRGHRGPLPVLTPIPSRKSTLGPFGRQAECLGSMIPFPPDKPVNFPSPA